MRRDEHRRRRRDRQSIGRPPGSVSSHDSVVRELQRGAVDEDGFAALVLKLYQSDEFYHATVVGLTARDPELLPAAAVVDIGVSFKLLAALADAAFEDQRARSDRRRQPRRRTNVDDPHLLAVGFDLNGAAVVVEELTSVRPDAASSHMSAIMIRVGLIFFWC